MLQENSETTLSERSSDDIPVQIHEIHPRKFRLDEMEDKILNRRKKL